MSEQNYFKSLIAIKNNQPVTTSKHVATVFDKKHKNVMKKIHKLVAQNGAAKNMFAKATYVNKQNRTMPMYYMNRDGFSLLVMGFTGPIATDFKIEFLKAFDLMQKQLTELAQKPSYMIANPVKRAERWIQEEKHFELVQKDDKKQRKLQQAFEATPKSVSISYFAKILKQNGIDMGRNRLFRWLRNKDYLISSRTDHNVPYQQYINQHLFELSEYSIDRNNHRIMVHVTRITPKGQQYFMNLFLMERNY